STLSWPGHLVEAALHLRREFDETLRQFVHAHDELFGGAHAELLAAAVDFDLLARPYVYRNTSLSLNTKPEVLEIIEVRPRGWLVESPYDIPREVSQVK